MNETVIVRAGQDAVSEVDVIRVGTVLYTDHLPYSPVGRRRVFWLLDYDVQMVYEPFGWVGEWYIDLVQVRTIREGQRVLHHVRDMEVDIIVENMGPVYRIIDLEKLGARALADEFTLAEVATVLHATQRFLDAFLHRGAPWPPPEIRPYFSPTHRYPADPLRSDN